MPINRTSLLGLLVGLPLASCGSERPLVKTPIRAMLVSSESGEYALRKVEFETLEDVRHLRGSLGSILGHASASVDKDPAEIIASSTPNALYKIQGQTVHNDYLVRDGIVIPQTFTSMEMMGLYYNFERTVLYWQTQLGVSFEQVGLPRVLYNPSLSLASNGVEGEISGVMNAAYLPGLRDLWFYKTSPHERIPVKMNFGVIAHEFGHFIFDFAFADYDQDNYNSKYSSNSFFLSGVNEGLADFFSYMVTGNTKEFAASLAILGKERTLPVSWTLSTLVAKDCRGGFYCEGSVLASALYEIAQDPGQSALSVGKNVLQQMPAFRRNWLQARDDSIVDQSLLLIPLIEGSGEAKTLYCSVFKKWFDNNILQAKLPCI